MKLNSYLDAHVDEEGLKIKEIAMGLMGTLSEEINIVYLIKEHEGMFQNYF